MYFDVAAKVFADEHIDGEKIAFAASDCALGWNELKTLSDKICDVFQKINIPAGEPILIYGDKEALFLASILSCYRNNLPFVPVGPGLPAARIQKMIAQTEASVILVCGDYKDVPVLPVSINKDLEIKSSETIHLNGAYKNIAYILFTSGSSGEPKGVLITQENLVSFTNWFVKKFPVSAETVFINQASFLFDISLADLFGALQTGGTAIFNSVEETNSGEFFERIKRYKGSHWNSTPSFLAVALLNKELNETSFPHLKTFVLSGEDLSPALIKQLYARFPNAKVINAYGPTETCIFASFAEIEPKMLEGTHLPIAKLPAENISIEKEEIIISGKPVGDGYLGGEKFMGTFHTGDRADVKNGYVYYMGRSDDQIKFNGNRVDLGEIRSVLENFSHIAQAECLPIIVDEKIKRLVAFIRSADNSPANVSALKTELQKLLPAYMIPSEIIFIDKFPLTSSSKIDRKKLLEDHLNG